VKCSSDNQMRGKDFNAGLRGALFEAKHYERMGAAIWLYGWLILRQTRQEGATGWVLGGKPIAYREINEETGFEPRTLERWMRVLRRGGYIETTTAPTGVVVRITKAKKFGPAALARARSIVEGARKNAYGGTQIRGTEITQAAERFEVAGGIGSGYVEREGKVEPCGLGKTRTQILHPGLHALPTQFPQSHGAIRVPRNLKQAAVRGELTAGLGPCVRSNHSDGSDELFAEAREAEDSCAKESSE